MAGQKRIKEFINTLLFETPGGQRFTLDSPVLPNVWMAYALAPEKSQDLILTVKDDRSSGKGANQLRLMIERLRGRAPDWGRSLQSEKELPRMTYIPGQIAVRLYFDELMRVVLPLTPWWRRNYEALKQLEDRYSGMKTRPEFTGFPQPGLPFERDLREALMLMRQGMGGQVPDLSSRARERYIRSIPVDLIWLVRIAGVIAHCAKNETSLFGEGDRVSKILEKDFKLQTFDEHYNTIDTSDDDAIVVAVDDARKARSEICNQFTKIYTEWCPDNEQPDEYFLWQATMNRKVELAGDDSSLTVKADAGRRLFDISCKKITWAVIDSGIDGNHPAFKNTSEEHEAEKLAQSDVPLDQDAGYTGVRIEDLESRVIKTIDFTDLRDLLDPDVLDPAVHETNDRRDQLIDSLARRMPDNGQSADGTGGDPRKAAEDALNELNLRIKGGHDIDWEALEPLIEDIKPKTPRNDHGTHVAGILAADWIDDDEEFTNFPLKQRPRRMQGVCPDIRLMDVRVFREQGDTEEFELLAAVQFLRWLNSRAGFMTVHGSNLSLSLVHEVRRFACGQTPICIECNEAAALGMVMVSAAGNRGYESEDLHMAGGRKGFRAISITDPGNAEQVITVGATHRKRPHDYGVSYFSSRGPTGDGRVKPDLVAPGEKIKGPAPNGGAEYKDGTSMAAPHVSGAAAMLMARHSELIGKPQRIKEILCDTATDLGRDPYFQGRGLVDILRALQSV